MLATKLQGQIQTVGQSVQQNQVILIEPTIPILQPDIPHIDLPQAPTVPATQTQGQSNQVVQNIVQKTEAAINNFTNVVNGANFKQTVLTNQQKTDFYNYAAQLYQTMDQTIQNIPYINLIGSIILQLEAISEKTITGKKQGNVRQDLVYNEALNYLLNRNVNLDDNCRVLLRGMMELTFLNNENRLIKIFNDVFEIGVGCMQCATQGSTILQNIIPVQRM